MCKSGTPPDSTNKIQTNGDLARSMDDDTLAEFIFEVMQFTPEKHIRNRMMIGAISKLLKQPVGFHFLRDDNKRRIEQ